MRKPYNGHESWNAWNVALWIGNDEPMYRIAVECLDHSKSLHRAANRFISMVGTERTPDGARFSHHSVELALAGLRE